VFTSLVQLIINMAKSSLLKATVKAIKAVPPEIFNIWLFFCTAVWSFSGVAKGFDEGMFELGYRRTQY